MRLIGNATKHMALVFLGYMSFNFAVPMSEHSVATRSPPNSAPANRKFLRLYRVQHKKKKCLLGKNLRARFRAAKILSLLHSARLNGKNVHVCIRDVLERLPTLPARRLSALLSHRWMPSQALHLPQRAASRRDDRALDFKYGETVMNM